MVELNVVVRTKDRISKINYVHVLLDIGVQIYFWHRLKEEINILTIKGCIYNSYTDDIIG